jgi:hypothetical protein
MKKRIAIDDLLRWTYRDELPKDGATSFLRPDGFGFGWGSVSKAGKYLADVQEPDVRNRFGLAPDLTAKSAPHPDAVSVYYAVQNLDELDFDLPEDWYPLADICPVESILGPSGLVATAKGVRQLAPADGAFTDGRGKRRLRRQVSDLIQRAAIIAPPEWRGEVPTIKKVSEYGKPKWYIRETLIGESGPYEVEIDGFDRKRRLPKPGAYQKTYLDPDPVETVITRAEYQIFVAASELLVADLRGRLAEHEPVTSDRSAWPWEGEDRPPPRVLVDLRPQPVIKRDPKPVAGPPPKRGIERPKEGRAA